MTAEFLYALFEEQRKDGEAETIYVARCSARRCRIVGHYRTRGSEVIVASPVRLSPARQSEYGAARKVPGRAWVGSTIPNGEIVGCDHFVARLDRATSPDGVLIP